MGSIKFDTNVKILNSGQDYIQVELEPGTFYFGREGGRYRAGPQHKETGLAFSWVGAWGRDGGVGRVGGGTGLGPGGKKQHPTFSQPFEHPLNQPTSQRCNQQANQPSNEQTNQPSKVFR